MFRGSVLITSDCWHQADDAVKMIAKNRYNGFIRSGVFVRCKNLLWWREKEYSFLSMYKILVSNLRNDKHFSCANMCQKTNTLCLILIPKTCF